MEPGDDPPEGSEIAAPTVVVETGDESPVAAAKLKAKRETDKQREKRINDAWGTVMASEAGRTVVWNVLVGRLGLYASPVMEHERAEQRAIGKHVAALELYERLRAEYPRQVRLMREENDR